MKTTFSTGVAASVGIVMGLLSSAQASQSSVRYISHGKYDPEISQTLKEIDKKLDNFKGHFISYYGLKSNGYASPSQAGVTGTGAKNREAFSRAHQDGTSQAATRSFSSAGHVTGLQYIPGFKSNLTQEDLVSFMTVPYSAKDCADCAITVNKIRERNAKDLTYPYTKVATSEILSAGSVGSGYLHPEKTASLNANSLLGPLTYPEETINHSVSVNSNNLLASVYDQENAGSHKVFGKDALGFIQHIVDRNRFRISPKLPPAGKLNADGSNARTTYLSQMYNFAAKISVGLGNIYQMYIARIPTAKDGKSKMQAEADMVMRRMQSDWQEGIKKANPSKVQKEIAFMLAEMNYQLYQNRLIMERLLLTQSVMEISASRGPTYAEAYS